MSLSRIYSRGDPEVFSIEIRALDWLSLDCESLEKAFTKQSTSFLARGSGWCLLAVRSYWLGHRSRKWERILGTCTQTWLPYLYYQPCPSVPPALSP